MRILYVLPEYPPHHGGGIVTFYEALLPELVRQGHDVDVLIGSAVESDGEPYQRDGVNVSYLEGERFERYLPYFGQYSALPVLQRHLAAAWAMHEQVDGGTAYDVVEVVDWGLLFVPWVIEGRVPSVVQLHGSTGQIDFRDPSPSTTLQGHVTRLLEAAVLRGADMLNTHSRANQAEWQEVTGRPVEYLPPPLESHAPPPEDQKRGDHGLVVGRVQYWKGPTVLCDALAQLGEQAPRVKWVGRDTPYGESGDSMAAHLQSAYPEVWDRIVEPVGQVEPDEVARLQAQAGFVLVPSLWDVYNLTAVEAMRQGAVVVCSTGAGAVDVIEDGVNGFEFPAGDASALAATLERVAGLSAEEREELSAAARATIEDVLDPQTIAAQKVMAYEAVVARGRAGDLDAWATAAARPTGRPAGGQARSLAFLDQQPLRDILAYSLRRMSDKVSPPFGS